MGQVISGPGIGLQIPQFLYPTEISPSIPYDAGTTQLGLAPGDELLIPAGTWYLGLGSYLVLEWLDPIGGVWRIVATAAWQSGAIYWKSDGFTSRIANRLGCPIAGVVTAPGNGSYVQASTSISVTGGGGSTWSPIVGGQLTMTTATIVTANSGAGYGVPPIVILPCPPGPSNNANGVGGVPASGFCAISSGTVSAFSFTNPGAGYPSGSTYTIVPLPNPTDPNLPTGITNATLVFSVTAAGSLTGILNTNPGAALSSPNNITLTVSGAGANATVSPVMLQTVTAASVIGGSTIAAAGSAMLTSGGGAYPTASFTNSPEFLGLAGRPRQANVSLTVGAAGTLAAQTGTIIDGGLFFSAPFPILNILSVAASTGTIIGSSTITFTTGSRGDIATLQPAP